MGFKISLLSNILFIILFLFFIPMLFSQEEESKKEILTGGYFIDTSSESPRFIQRLVWEKDEYAIGYDVIITEKREDSYHEYRRYHTEENYVEDSLPPGIYRYCVIPYDLLNMKGAASEWSKDIEVLTAFLPEIEQIFPNEFLLDKRWERILEIRGDNFIPGMDIYLTNSLSYIRPRNINFISDKKIELLFDDDDLNTGIYSICIVDRSGLRAKKDGFIIKYRKPLDFFIKTIWAPIIPVYGQMSDVFSHSMNYLGATLSFEAISSKLSSFNGGFEIALSAFAVNPAYSFRSSIQEIADGYKNRDSGISRLVFDINIVTQKWFYRRRMAVSIRFGIGAAFGGGSDVYEQNFLLTIGMNGGVSYLALIEEIFFVEAGVDLVHQFSQNHSGYIKPKLGIGWLF
jgi:hypothetical protein